MRKIHEAWPSKTPKLETRKFEIWRKLKDVSVSGLKVVLDVHSPPLRRIMWGCLLAVCFSIMLAQCMNRVLRYLDEPVKVSVRVMRNTSLNFPAVTMCNLNAFNLSAALQLLRKQHMTVKNVSDIQVSQLLGSTMNPTELWTKLAHDLDVFIFSCWFSRGQKCYQRGTWTRIFTVLGPCFTFMLHEANVYHVGRFHNLFLSLRETTPPAEESGVRILVHERHETPVVDVFTRGFTVDVGWSRQAKLELRKFHLVNTRRSNCDESRTYSQRQCIVTCLEKSVLDVARCRLPFMSQLHIKVRECSTPAKYETAMNVTRELLVSSDWLTNCSCPRQCHQTQFLTYPDNEGFLRNQLKSRVYFEGLVFEQITEVHSYPLISLLCDIGSTLGLLMGASVLTICELLEVAYSKISKYNAQVRLPSPVATKKFF